MLVPCIALHQTETIRNQHGCYQLLSTSMHTSQGPLARWTFHVLWHPWEEHKNVFLDTFASGETAEHYKLALCFQAAEREGRQIRRGTCARNSHVKSVHYSGNIIVVFPVWSCMVSSAFHPRDLIVCLARLAVPSCRGGKMEWSISLVGCVLDWEQP